MVSPGWPAVTEPRLGTAIQPCGDERNVALESANNQADSIASTTNERADPRVVVVGGQTGS